jgi:quercetin dioxygenase-like cupin family protein
MSTDGFVLQPGRSRSGPAREGWITRVTGVDTEGLVTIGEAEIPPRTSGPSLHVHSNEDEAYLVLEGILTVQLGDDRFTVPAGGLAWLPRGIPHTFANLNDQPVRANGLILPAGLEGMFAEIAEYVGGLQGPPDESRFAEIESRYGMATIGPPIDASRG